MLSSTEDILNNYNNNICNKCNLTIHPNFIGYHKCGYANCPICKNAITNSQYWYHIRSHPGHQNDNPPPLQPPRREKAQSREYMTSYSGGRNSDSRKRSFEVGSPAVEVGKEYEIEITQIKDL